MPPSEKRVVFRSTSEQIFERSLIACVWNKGCFILCNLFRPHNRMKSESLELSKQTKTQKDSCSIETPSWLHSVPADIDLSLPAHSLEFTPRVRPEFKQKKFCLMPLLWAEFCTGNAIHATLWMLRVCEHDNFVSCVLKVSESLWETRLIAIFEMKLKENMEHSKACSIHVYKLAESMCNVYKEVKCAPKKVDAAVWFVSMLQGALRSSTCIN